MLDLAVSSRVGYCRPLHTDVMPFVEVQELFASELSAVVGDDDVGNPKLVDDVGEEKDGLLGADVRDGSSLDPFGEFCRWPPANGCTLLSPFAGAPLSRVPTPRMAT